MRLGEPVAVVVVPTENVGSVFENPRPAPPPALSRSVGVVGSRPSGEERAVVVAVAPTSIRPDGDVIRLGDVPRVRTAAAAASRRCCSWGGSVNDG